mgnify:CR=1 FL=1
MARIDDTERVFDVSRPHRIMPSATSKPAIIGHHPRTIDPMVHLDKPVPEEPAKTMSEKKITPVHVSWDEAEPPAAETPKEDAGPDLNSLTADTAVEEAAKPAETQKSSDEIYPSAATGVGQEAPADAPPESWSNLNTSADTAEEIPPPSEALPIVDPPGASRRGGFKGFLEWAAIVLFLFGFGGYLAVDAGIVGANVKLPFEIFKEKKDTPAATIPAPPPTPKITQKALPAKELPAFTLTSDWTEHAVETAGLKFAHPKSWKLESASSLGNETRLLRSPDFNLLGEEESVSPMHEGGRILVDIRLTSKKLDEYKAGDQNFNPQSIIKLDGEEGVFGTCNAETVCAYIPYKNAQYFFSYEQPDAEQVKTKTGKDPVTPKDKYLEVFLKLLSSVSFSTN